MFGKRIVLKVSAAIAAVLIAVACTSQEESWQQQINDEASSIDINLSDTWESPTFEFSMDEHPPQFSILLCKGASDDRRVQEDAWYTYFDEAAKYGPFDRYWPEFIAGDDVNGEPVTRVMVLIYLNDDATVEVAQEVARKMMGVMKRVSPCR